jgi:LPS O-antigen subunit length determinant protein (WzzB/FepE family)
MSETQNYKTITLTQEQALEVEIAIRHRIDYLTQRVRHVPQMSTDIANLMDAVEVFARTGLTK